MAVANSVIPELRVKIPCSVQKVLLDNKIIDDWNIGLNARECEWVENRHWIFKTSIPDKWFKKGKKFELKFKGLDYSGWIYFTASGKDSGEDPYFEKLYRIH